MRTPLNFLAAGLCVFALAIAETCAEHGAILVPIGIVAVAICVAVHAVKDELIHYNLKSLLAGAAANAGHLDPPGRAMGSPQRCR